MPQLKLPFRDKKNDGAAPTSSEDAPVENQETNDSGLSSPSSGTSVTEDELTELEETLWRLAEAGEKIEERASFRITRSSRDIADDDDVLPMERLPDGTLISPDNLVTELKVETDGGGGEVVVRDGKVSGSDDNEPLPASLSLESLYGQPLPVDEVSKLMGPKWTGPAKNHPGLIYHAHIFLDDTPPTSPAVKPRRGTLAVRSSHFFSSIVKLPDNRYAFSGTLNGWPGLGTHLPLEVLSITYRKKSARGKMAPFAGGKIKRWWTTDYELEQHPPSLPPEHMLPKILTIRATLRTPAWAGYGWSPTSPGFAWYFNGEKTVLFGKEISKSTLEGLNDRAVRAHMFQHRYAMPVGKRETPKDLLTYHSGTLIEWEREEEDGATTTTTPAKYVTVIEMALLNGMGGYKGRSNFYHDKDDAEKGSNLYRCTPPELILPWRYDRSEIRMQDMPHCPTVPDFMSYMRQYEGPGQRFVDPQIVRSHRVRLSHRTKRDIAMYLNNNVMRDGRYSEIDKPRNCQTFAADLFGFLVGKKKNEPIGAINRLMPGYVPRTHLFLYDAELYRGEEEVTE